jgi:prepilin-type processing-associated H-X9-DG protein/prepilin-type N-terminal cleavage/methylation domain-containing protein
MATVTRRAVTLVELLVVVGVIGVLLAVLLPAVHLARGAASRISCASNLRQLALACHSYHESHGRFPPGHLRFAPLNAGLTPAQPPPPFNDPALYRQFWGWPAHLLPFLGEPTAVDWTVAAWNQDVGAQRVRVLECPADNRSHVTYDLGGRLLRHMSYQGVNGTDQYTGDGVLACNRARRADEVVDGLASTLLIGESPGDANGFFRWASGYGSAPYIGTGDMLLGVAERPLPTDIPQWFRQGHYVSDYTHLFHFWSSHNAGANFAFADGSVRFIAYHPTALVPLATVAGGEPIDP